MATMGMDNSFHILSEIRWQLGLPLTLQLYIYRFAFLVVRGLGPPLPLLLLDGTGLLCSSLVAIPGDNL